MHETISVVLNVCETWKLIIQWGKHRLVVFKDKVLNILIEPNKEKVR